MSFIVQTKDGKNTKCLLCCSSCGDQVFAGKCYKQKDSNTLNFVCKDCVKLTNDDDDDLGWRLVTKIYIKKS